jgi:1-deoxy-D-xylulose-5-phosphate synthase
MPVERLIDLINSPADLKKIPPEKLKQVSDEIRQLIIDTVSTTGGHLASSLGAVELTVALHYIFEAPDDFIFWDVGHQSYAHKILTGRRKDFATLRQLGGISGFPNKNESPYDPVTCGHSSTSISNALGVAAARDLYGMRHKVVVVIGDAALAGGMAFEALNHAGHLKKDMVIVLNDNEMSIAHSIGAMSRYLNRIISAPIYNKVRREVEGLVKRIPRLGFRVYRAARRLEEGLKNLLIPGILFEELGFRYFGPIDGHNINLMIETIKNVKDLNEPVLIHVITKKGRGYKFAEETPDKFHGIGPFCKETGEKIASKEVSFTEAFSEKIAEIARGNDKVVAVTAAMCDGTGLEKFSKEFPARFFDVGIAEGHAVGFAAGLALGGLVPVVAIYSTFLQRSYDQLIHDVALQNLHVVFCLDRAGLVGEDGPTHHGPFDVAYLSAIPNMVIMAPCDQKELADMLEFAVGYNNGPVAIRYPRGGIIKQFAGAPTINRNPIELGISSVLQDGKDLAIVALGSMVYPALDAAEILTKKGIAAYVVNARFAKPFDVKLFLSLSKKTNKFLIVEEGIVQGGFGSNVIEFFHSQNKDAKIKLLGLPDMFIEHGPRRPLLERYGLSKDSIAKAAEKLL